MLLSLLLHLEGCVVTRSFLWGVEYVFHADATRSEQVLVYLLEGLDEMISYWIVLPDDEYLRCLLPLLLLCCLAITIFC